MRARPAFLLVVLLLAGCGDGSSDEAPTLAEPLGEPGSVRSEPWELQDCPVGGKAPVAYDGLDDFSSNLGVVNNERIGELVRPSNDLARVQVGSVSGFVCVEFETAAEPEGEVLRLLMRQPGKDDSGGLVTLEVTALEGPEPEGVDFELFEDLATPTGYIVHTNAPAPAADLSLDEDELPDLPDEALFLFAATAENAVSGVEVRQRGRVVSVVAPWDVFASDLVKDFEWTAHSTYTPPEEQREGNEQYYDCVPEGPNRIGLGSDGQIPVPGGSSTNYCP